MKKHQLFGAFKISFLLLCLSLTAPWTAAQTDTSVAHKEVKAGAVEQEIISLSKDKWHWMSERDLKKLENLFHDRAVFVHMGGTMSRQQELDVIKSGGIHYKKAEVHEVSVEVIGNTAICLNKITLLAVVGGNEVTNPFVVTEIYVQENGIWKLASLSFTRTITPEQPRK
jgi:4-carboxymuconolactone decarboxylase